MSKQVLLSGIQPTGTPHIGNYLGALKNWVATQNDYDALYCIVDLHALTIDRDPDELRNNITNSVKDLLAIGLDPDKAPIFVQSHVSEHAELAWIFNTLTPVSELERMTQYKDKSTTQKSSNAGLLTYPLLMAADILLYQAGVVPVGDDQLQHIELARIVARKFNNKYKEGFFVEPEGHLTEAKRIMSLSEPSKKMSKSHGEANYIALTDDPDTVVKKIRKAVTDAGDKKDGGMSEGVQNLFDLLHYCGADDVHTKLHELYSEGSLQYSTLKDAAAEAINAMLSPIQEKRSTISDADVKRIIAEGDATAKERAHKTLMEVHELIGLR
ncbi:MAG: tryptophan--tRNA ligase [Patescibacteria group bacterium]